MYEVSQAFLDSLDHNGRQYILGTIRLPSDETIFLDDSNLVGYPEYSRQCTSDADIFAIGQLHSGTAKITVRMPEIRREELRGGTLILRFKVDNADDWVPLGMWTITEPTRRERDFIEIVAEDCISRLDVPINENYVGLIDISARMKKVTELTGVRFAQTAEEIEELMNVDFQPVAGTSFCNNCREEVASIAKLIGGIAYADRHGRIAFRRFGNKPVLTINAARRHKASLAEYTFGIRGISYSDKNGYTTTIKWSGSPVNTAAVLGLSGIIYVWERNDDDKEKVDNQYRTFLEGTAENLHIPSWTPGEIEYYGNPALDLGDLVELEGGINGNETTFFLITSDNWRFRGPQTLISAGADTSSGRSSSYSSGSSQVQQLITQVNVEKNIAVVEMSDYAGFLTDEFKIAANGAFSVREQTIVFADITANICGLSSTEFRMNLLFDDEMQAVHVVETLRTDERRTIHFTAHFTALQGKHTVTAEACGNVEIECITAAVWGQNITPEMPEPAYVEDYLYTVMSDDVTIDKYIGSSVSPTVPKEIEGKRVTVIGDKAFMGTEIKSVYIPKGVEEIK